MSLEVKIHNAQLLILRELLFQPQANYAMLQKPTELTSDHFNFHISRLLELGLIERVAKGAYSLSTEGKEYANKLDTDNNTIERQPKMAVMLFVCREVGGEVHYLIQQRQKNPNYGFHGFPTGKVRWGETLIQAAQRELKEETNLQADFTIRGAYHEHTLLKDTAQLIEDKLFFICQASNVTGDLREQFEGGKNQWLTLEAYAQKEQRFSSVESELALLHSDQWLIEKTVAYESAVF